MVVFIDANGFAKTRVVAHLAAYALRIGCRRKYKGGGKRARNHSNRARPGNLANREGLAIFRRCKMSLMPKSHDHRKELETVRRYSSVRWVFSRGLGGKDEISRRRTLCIAVLYGVDAHFYDG